MEPTLSVGQTLLFLKLMAKLPMNLKGKTWAVCPPALHLPLGLIKDTYTSQIKPLMVGLLPYLALPAQRGKMSHNKESLLERQQKAWSGGDLQHMGSQ